MWKVYFFNFLLLCIVMYGDSLINIVVMKYVNSLIIGKLIG